MNEFFTLLEEKIRKSVEMTLDVLKERRRLEACVSNLKQRISERELKTEELMQIQEALRQNRDKIPKCENFQFTVSRSFKEKMMNGEWWWNRNATCCSVCEENCHESCRCEGKCSVMKNTHCTKCTGRCHYSKHIRDNRKYVVKTKHVTMTFAELRQEYAHTADQPETSFDKNKYDYTKTQHESIKKESDNKTEIEENLIRDLEKIKNEKSNLLHEAYVIIMSLRSH